MQEEHGCRDVMHAATQLKGCMYSERPKYQLPVYSSSRIIMLILT